MCGEQELIGVWGDAEPVQQALEGIAGRDEIAVLPGFASAVEQAGPHLSRENNTPSLSS